MTASLIPAIKTQQILEYFGWTKKAPVNLNGIQPGIPAYGWSRAKNHISPGEPYFATFYHKHYQRARAKFWPFFEYAGWERILISLS